MRTTIGMLFAALSLSLPVRAVEVDALAAMVGTDAILKSDVYQELRRMHADESFYSTCLQSLIDRKLILQAAVESKMTMQDWVVESRIREIIDRSFEGDRNKLMETLSLQKVSYPEWRQRMKDDMLVAAMHWNVIDKNAVVRPGELRKLYESHPERYCEGGKVTVSVILLKPEDVELRDTVNTALTTNDFASVARQYSADSRASEGGLWKDINPSEVFKPEICEEIGELQQGVLSRWIDIDGWNFLLRKDAEEKGRKLTFAEAYAQLEEEAKAAETKALYDAWIERLRSETYIKVY